MSQWPHDLAIDPEILKRLPPEFRAVLEAVVDHYEKRIAELEARLNKTPKNTTLPPAWCNSIAFEQMTAGLTVLARAGSTSC